MLEINEISHRSSFQRYIHTITTEVLHQLWHSNDLFATADDWWPNRVHYPHKSGAPTQHWLFVHYE